MKLRKIITIKTLLNRTRSHSKLHKYQILHFKIILTLLLKYIQYNTYMTGLIIITDALFMKLQNL